MRIEDVAAIPEVLNKEALNCNQIRNQNRELKKIIGGRMSSPSQTSFRQRKSELY